MEYSVKFRLLFSQILLVFTFYQLFRGDFWIYIPLMNYYQINEVLITLYLLGCNYYLLAIAVKENIFEGLFLSYLVILIGVVCFVVYFKFNDEEIFFHLEDMRLSVAPAINSLFLCTGFYFFFRKDAVTFEDFSSAYQFKLDNWSLVLFYILFGLLFMFGPKSIQLILKVSYLSFGYSILCVFLIHKKKTFFNG